MKNLTSKICIACKETKSIEEFYLRNKETKYRESFCKRCSKDRVAIKNKSRRQLLKQKDPEKYDQYLKNETTRSRTRRQDADFRANIIVSDSRRGDKTKGRSNDLTVEFVQKLIDDGCSYCFDSHNRMTIDRIDNSLGHTQDNVVPACVRCNYTRGNMPYLAWLKIAPIMLELRVTGQFEGWVGDLRHK